MGSTYTYTQSQLTAMTTALANANSDYNAGDYADANAALLQYYQAQVTGDPSSNRGYAQAAIDVINNVGSGAVANLNVQNAVGASAYTDQFKSNISLSLATQDLSQITGNNDLMPTLAQVADEHATVFGELGIPIENWGGTAFEAVGDNYINAAGYSANPAELSQIQSTNFTNLPVSTITDAYNNLYGAGFSALGQLNLPADVMGALNMSGLGVKIDAQYGTDLVPLTPPPGGLTPLGFLDTGNGTYQLAETNASTGTTSTVSYSATGVPLSTTTTSGTPLPASFDGLSILSVSANPADAELLLQTPNGGASSFLLPASDLLNIQTGMPNGVLTTNGNQDSLLIDLDNATIDASGSGNYILALGTGAMVNAGTGSNTILLAANSDSASASNAAIIVAAGISNVTLTGNNDIDTTGTSSFVLSGNDDTDNATGGTITTIAGDTGEVITGSGFSLNASAGEFNGTVTGSNNSFSLDANSGSTLSLSGTGNTAVTVGNTIQLVGASSSATISGADTVDLEAANQKLILDTTGDTIDTIANDTGETITGSSLTLDGSGLLSGVVTGANDTFNLSANSGSTLGLSGTGDVANSIGNTIQLDGASSSATISGADTVDLEAINQKLTLDTTGDTVNTITSATGETIVMSSGAIYGENNDQLSISGSGDTISDGLSSTTDITGSNDTLWYAGAGSSVSVVGQSDTLDMSSGTIYGQNNDQLSISGSGDTISDGLSSTTDITGSNDTLWYAGAGSSVAVLGQSDVIDMSSGTIYGQNNDQLSVDGSGDTITDGLDSTTDITGSNDTVSYAGIGSSVAVLGQSDAIDMSSGTIYGQNNDQLSVNGSGDTITDGLDSTTDITGSNDTLSYAGTGSSITVVGQSNALDMSSGTLFLEGNNSVDGSGDTIDQQLNSMSTTVVGSGNIIGTTDAASSDTLFLEGNNTIDGSGDTINQQLNSMSTTVVGSNDTIKTTDGASLDTLFLEGNNTVDGSSDTIDQQLGSMTTTVVGNNDVLGTTDNASNDTIDFGNNAIDDTLDVSGDTINASAGSFTLDGSHDIFDGSASDLSVSGQSDTIDLSNATVDVSGDDNVTIDGSGDKIVGGSGDTFTIDGIGDDISATSSSVTFDGSNTGDDISGSGDTWSDPGDGGDGGDGGYYGYGLTSWQGRGATAAQMAAAQKKSGASGSVYENASWADKTVTWSFASASGSNAITNTAEQVAVEQAFKAWAAASGLTFEEASAGTASDIEVGFGDLNTATSNTIGLTHYTYAGGELQAGVQVQLESPGQAPLTTDASGQLMYASTGASFEQVALHEIGHALGLADNDVTGSIMNMVLGTSNSTLDATDIANIQELYSGSMAGTSSSGSGIAAQSTAQLHQLLQAMASFDAGSGVADTVAPSLQDLAQTGYLSIGPSQAHLAHAV